MENTTASNIKWEQLASSIEEGTCVLFFGPEASVNYKDKLHQDKFFTQLLEQNSEEIYTYHKENGLFVLSDPGSEYDICLCVKPFLQEDYSSPMLEKLAKIPFHFIVMLTADLAFEKEMSRQGFAFNQASYLLVNDQQEKDQPPPELPTKSTLPLFYHLLGTADNTQSIIVSHRQMYNYIKALLGEAPPLPQNLKTALNVNNAKNLLFIGINFDKWYFQLILNMLGVDATSTRKHFVLIQDGGDITLQSIWKKDFKITFVPHHIDEFVDTLHQFFTANNKLLRKSSNTPGRQLKRTYNTAQIRKFLETAMDDSDLKSLYMDYFPEVENKVSEQMGKGDKIGALVDYCQKNIKLHELLKLMEEKNPAQYQNNSPYYEEQ